MRDHYEVLGVSPEASAKEIKSAFRKRAKSRHPDTGADGDEEMRLTLEAYKVLSDPQARREYDRGRLRLVKHDDRSAFDYRVWLKERLDEPEYVAKLIVYDLLHGLEDEALELYEGIRDVDEGRLERYFERPEAMDAEFCLAEEYAQRGRLDDAFKAMKKLIAMEQRSSGFGYFYDVVLARFRRLVLEEFPRAKEPEAMLDVLAEALDAKSSAENDAQFLRRKAEILLRLGRNAEARAAVIKAGILQPKLPGLRTLNARLGGASARGVAQ